MKILLLLILSYLPLVCQARAEVDKDSLQLFKQVIRKVQNEYYEPKDSFELTFKAISGLLSSLDRYSVYLSEADFQMVKMKSKGNFIGIGAELGMNSESRIEVLSCLEGSPAYMAGVKPSDVITEIDDCNLEPGVNIAEAIRMMMGAQGRKIKLKVLRGGERAIEFVITRAKLALEGVNFAHSGGIFYVRINSFTDGSFTALEMELDDMLNRGSSPTGLILDLRSNLGGLFEKAVQIADLFLAKGDVIVITKSQRKKKTVSYRAQQPVHAMLQASLPLIILINGSTASSAEILVSALKDHRKAIVVGERSLGKGSIQTVIPLGDGNGAIKLTTAKYLTSRGEIMDGKGVEPEFKVDYLNLCDPKEHYISLQSNFEVLRLCDSQVAKAVALLAAFPVIALG